jgi:hypothetical protein
MKPTPDIVAEKLASQLKEPSFPIDQNGVLVVTAGADSSIVLIVGRA